MNQYITKTVLEQSAVFSYPEQEELMKIERRKVHELKAADYNPKINLRASGVLEHPGMLKKIQKNSTVLESGVPRHQKQS